MLNSEGPAGDGLEALNQRLARLEAALNEIVGRLEIIERRAPIHARPLPPPPPVAKPLEVASPMRYVEPAAEAPSPGAGPQARDRPPAHAQPAVTPPPVARKAPKPAPAARPRRELPEGWESELLLKWAGRVGAAALILGAIYALQYLIANGYLSPPAQVGLGVAAGLALLVFGDMNLRKQRQALGEALFGAGIALLYLSTYAAYALYETPLLAYPAAFACLAAVTALAVAVAVRGNAQSAAILAVLGGFLTPVLLRRPPSHGEGPGLHSMVALFAYVTALDLGLLAVSLYQRWRPLQVLCFAATWVLLWGWLGDHDDDLTRYYTVIPAAVLFGIFLLAPVIRNLRLRSPTLPEELGLILANPSCFFPTAVVLVSIHFREYLGLMAVALAVLYLILGEIARRRNPEDKLLHLAWLSLGLTLVTVAVPLQFEGKWIMIAWGVEGALLVGIGHRVGSYTVRALGLILQTVVFAWLLVLYAIEDAPLALALPFLHPLFLSYLVGAATVAASLAFYGSGAAPEHEKASALKALSVGLAALVLWGVTCELRRLDMPAHVHMVWWALAAAAVMGAGHRFASYALRVTGVLLDGVVMVWLVILYLLGPQPVWLTWDLQALNEVFLAYVAGVLSIAASLGLYGRSRSTSEGERGVAQVLAVVVALLSLWGVTCELSRLHMPTHIHLAWWAAATLTMVWWGRYSANPHLRHTGLLLQGLMAVWMLVSPGMDAPPRWLMLRWPIINEAFIAYLLGLASLAGTARLYGQAGEGVAERRAIAPTIAVALAVLGLWSLTGDMLRLDAPTHLHLAWWSLASVAIVWLGLGRKSLPLRIVGVLAQGVVAFWLLLLYSLHPRLLWALDFQPLVNELFAAFLLGLGSLALTARLYRDAGLRTPDAEVVARATPLAVALIGLWGLTADVSRGLRALAAQYSALGGSTGFGISLLWCLYAGGLVWYGVTRRAAQLRGLGVGLFGLAVLKVFVYDSWTLDKIWRILSYCCLGIILISVSYAYHLYGERLRALFAAEDDARKTEPPPSEDGGGASY